MFDGFSFWTGYEGGSDKIKKLRITDFETIRLGKTKGDFITWVKQNPYWGTDEFSSNKKITKKFHLFDPSTSRS